MQQQRTGPPAPTVQPTPQGFGGYAYWPQPNQQPSVQVPTPAPIAAPNAPNGGPYPYAPNPASYPGIFFFFCFCFDVDVDVDCIVFNLTKKRKIGL